MSVSTTVVKKKTKSIFFFRITVDVSNGKELKTSPFIVSYLLPEKGIKKLSIFSHFLVKHPKC